MSRIEQTPGHAQEPSTERSPQSLRPFCIGWQEFLHLLAAYSLSVSQPILDRLKNNTGFLSQQAMSPAVIILGTAVICLAIPALLFAVCWAAGRRSLRAARWMHLISLGILFALGTNLINRAVGRMLLASDRTVVPAFILLSICAVVSWWLVRQYRRTEWMSQLLTLTSVSAILFPTLFLMSGPVRSVLFPDELLGLGDRLEAKSPRPIVWIVFDGLSGMAILDGDHKIDADRYPNFARLAGLSTYYRNASTVHPRTDQAVPAMLTGRYPVEELPPVRDSHPDNLFTLLHRTMQFTPVIFEPYTRLCPTSLKYHPHTREPLPQLAELLGTSGLVYLKTTLPEDLCDMIRLPAIPRAWFRLPDEQLVDRNVFYGMMVYSWDVDRELQVEHFIDCLKAQANTEGDQQAFNFLHVMLPHYPWNYLPDGRSYGFYMTAADYPLGAHGDLGEDWGPDELATNSSWKRYLLQLQYADLELGRILDAMEEFGTLDESLLIVTADHGESFIPGTSRRVPSTKTLPEIMPVPLFIKLPGQTEPSMTDRNVETIDILPTVADVIGLELPMAVDGESLLDETIGPRLRKTMHVGSSQIVVEGDFPERFSYAELLEQQWGTGKADRLWEDLVLPELVGKPLAEFRIDRTMSEKITMTWGAVYQREAHSDVLHCLYQGEFTSLREMPSRPFHVAIAVDGVIAGITRTLNDKEFFDDWSVLIHPRFIKRSNPEVQIFRMIETGQTWTLVPCVEG